VLLNPQLNTQALGVRLLAERRHAKRCRQPLDGFAYLLGSVLQRITKLFGYRIHAQRKRIRIVGKYLGAFSRLDASMRNIAVSPTLTGLVLLGRCSCFKIGLISDDNRYEAKNQKSSLS
jgi:hypothetical protein